MLAHPRTTLARVGTRGDVAAIAEWVDREAAGRVVVGLPLDLQGRVGHRARRVLVLVEALRAALGVPVDTWDERFSTVAVERTLIEADLSRKKRKEVIDRGAAAFILQGWLDAQRQAR